jgi:hypothetical protein
MANLHAASSQWAERPADQRFWNLSTMRAACVAARNNSAESVVQMSSLEATTLGDDIALQGRAGTPAKFTHYAFGQFCSTVGAPASYLRELPAPVAASCLNVGIGRANDSKRHLLLHKNGGLTLRASLSDKYDRVWDDEVCTALMRLTEAGWRAPAGRWNGQDDTRAHSRPAAAEDILPGQINIAAGDEIIPSGLYASDHDMFAFLVAPDRVISDGAGGALMRGVMVRNSEVGDSSLSFTFFLMQAVCGNHIIWNATGVHEIRMRHVGEGVGHRAFRAFNAQLRAYHDSQANEEEGIRAARNLVLGTTKDECLDVILKYAKGHSLPLSKDRVSEALATAEDHEAWYGDPRTLWAAVAGLTHNSQGKHADARSHVDAAAGKLLQMAF